MSIKMKEIRAVQMKMARYLFSVCDKYGLKIWAEGGTMQGAVREKGYIPWDDDMDLMMLREDYDKLISVADKEFSSPYHLQSFGRDRHYYRGHAQMRCDGTAAILPDDIWKPYHQGIFIDIFVYDSVPDEDTPEWNRALERADFIQDTLMSTSLHSGRITSLKTYVKCFKSCVYCLMHGRHKLIKEYDDLFRQFDVEENKRLGAPSFRRINRQRWIQRKEWYREGEYMPFEDMQVMVPVEYDKALKAQYGDDYMTPVKEPNIHGKVIFDTERDYKVVLKELRKRRRVMKFRKIIN